CLIFIGMFILSFAMGYQAHQPSVDPAFEGDAAEAPPLSMDRIPPLPMAGRGRPEAVIPEAPVAAPTPAAEPPADAPSAGKYTLQVATFQTRDRVRAESLAGKLKSAGLTSAIFTVKGTRSEHVVVCAGAFESRSSGEAKAFEKRVKDLREGGRALVPSATLWRSTPQNEVPGVHR
ncbi:MAG: SPOR domain-containing protein, partial [Planctomycetota bacterium]